MAQFDGSVNIETELERTLLVASLYLLPGETGLYSVYRLTFPCGKTYVGQSGRRVLSRIAEHAGCGRDPLAYDRLDLRDLSGNLAIQQELRYHGTATVEVLNQSQGEKRRDMG